VNPPLTLRMLLRLQDDEVAVSTYRALTQLGALECVQLTDMFFGRDLDASIQNINQTVMYFDTLFMHIEVQTFGGSVDGQIDKGEFFEGTVLVWGLCTHATTDKMVSLCFDVCLLTFLSRQGSACWAFHTTLTFPWCTSTLSSRHTA